MNDTFYLDQISETGNLDANLISCQNKLNVMAPFLVLKSTNPTLKKIRKGKKF